MVSELLPGTLDLFHFKAGGHPASLLGYARMHVFAHIPDVGWAAFAYSVAYTAVCFVPVWVLYRKKIFLKV
jgi:hypothetical protein